MKICFMAHSVHPTAGGSTKYFFEVVQEIRKQGHYVTLICTDKASSRNIKVDELLFVKSLVKQVPVVQTILFGLLAFLKVRRRNFDVYCFESGYMGIWTILFKLRKKGPLVSFSMRYGWKMLRLNLQNSCTILRPLRPYVFLYILWELIFFIGEVLDVRLSDRVIVLSNESKKVWVDSGIDPTKIEVIPYGVNLGIYKPLKIKKDQELLRELKIRENDKIILYVGHLEPLRNVDKLIMAFSILLRKIKNSEINENFKLIIVGSGLLEKRLKKLVNKLRLSEHVRFVPHIHDEIKLNKFYNLGNLFVLPQVPGTTSILAMACGLPVVTIKNKLNAFGTIDERILGNFIFADSANPEKISETCYKLLKNPEILSIISKKSLKMIADYSWQNVSIKLIKSLEQLVSKKV